MIDYQSQWQNVIDLTKVGLYIRLNTIQNHLPFGINAINPLWNVLNMIYPKIKGTCVVTLPLNKRNYLRFNNFMHLDNARYKDVKIIKDKH